MKKNLFIRGSHRQYVSEEQYLVPPVTQQMPYFRRHIVVEEKLHDGGPAICSATKASISVRWSS